MSARKATAKPSAKTPSRPRKSRANASPGQAAKKPKVAAVDLRDVRSRSDFVYDYLCQAISQGRFRQGMRLGEEDIAGTLGVSRTPVREALRRLQARGLLTIGAGRSLVVTELSRQQIVELYAMREILEGSAARFAAQYANESDVRLLRQIHQQFLDNWDEPQKAVYFNRQLHQAIYEAARNRYLTEALSQLHDAFALFNSSTFRAPAKREASDAEHLEIIEAIAAHDLDRAEQAARRHIRLAQQTRFF